MMFITYRFTSERSGLLQRQQILMECINRINLVNKLIDFALRLSRTIYVFYHKQVLKVLLQVLKVLNI